MDSFIHLFIHEINHVFRFSYLLIEALIFEEKRTLVIVNVIIINVDSNTKHNLHWLESKCNCIR